MGKVKKLRQKYHLSLQKSKSLNNLSEDQDKKDLQLKNNLFKSSENIFAGVDISWDSLTKSLPKDFDASSIVSSKSRKDLKEEEKHLKKKEKQKLRHERFMQKLDVAYQIRQNLKSKKKKRNKTVVEDMSSLLDALPSLSEVNNSSSEMKLEKFKPFLKSKPKGILKAKQRIKQQHYDSKLFRKILEDKTFKENPLQAINQYLKQKVKVET